MSASITKKFQLMVQKVKDDKKLRLLNAEQTEISSEKEPGEYDSGVWRVIMSDDNGRPFFYNTVTKIGQFSIPDELSLNDIDEESEHEEKLHEFNGSDNGFEDLQGDSEDDPFESNCLTQSRTRSQSQFSTSNKVEKLPKSSSVSNGNSQSEKLGKKGKKMGSGHNFEEDPGNICSDDNREVFIIHDLSDDNDVSGSKSKNDINKDSQDEPIEEVTGRGEGDLGNQDSDTDDKWTCSHCTYNNFSAIFSCELCAHPSGRQRQGRSQKDNLTNGSIMHAFSGTQTQSSNPLRNAHSTWGMNDGTQTTDNINSTSKPESISNTNSSSRNTKKRVSSSTSILDYGSSKRNQSNSSKRRS